MRDEGMNAPLIKILTPPTIPERGVVKNTYPAHNTRERCGQIKWSAFECWTG